MEIVNLLLTCPLAITAGASDRHTRRRRVPARMEAVNCCVSAHIHISQRLRVTRLNLFRPTDMRMLFMVGARKTITPAMSSTTHRRRIVHHIRGAVAPVAVSRAQRNKLSEAVLHYSIYIPTTRLFNLLLRTSRIFGRQMPGAVRAQRS